MFFSILKIWKKSVETKTGFKLSSLWIDGENKYVSLTLKTFCYEKDMVMEFTSLYIPK